MKFTSIIFFAVAGLFMQSSQAAKIILVCPRPDQLEISKEGAGIYSIKASLNVIQGNVASLQMYPNVLHTKCHKIIHQDAAAFYEGVLDCHYSCSYDGGYDYLVFFSTDVHEMQPAIENCKFSEGDAQECHYKENNCNLLCTTTPVATSPKLFPYPIIAMLNQSVGKQ